ncbi:hypothetical protein GF326_06500 [Candidatus Bathyarchaeota archaeon]|nr:hypothetical protein [Candidatus Bathyarchaeota archaeon]
MGFYCEAPEECPLLKALNLSEKDTVTREELTETLIELRQRETCFTLLRTSLESNKEPI